MCKHMSQHSNSGYCLNSHLECLLDLWRGNPQLDEGVFTEWGPTVFDQVQHFQRRGLLGHNESQVSSEGRQLRQWLSLTILTQTFCHSHIKSCPLLKGENEGRISHGEGCENVHLELRIHLHLYFISTCEMQPKYWAGGVGF